MPNFIGRKTFVGDTNHFLTFVVCFFFFFFFFAGTSCRVGDQRTISTSTGKRNEKIVSRVRPPGVPLETHTHVYTYIHPFVVAREKPKSASTRPSGPRGSARDPRDTTDRSNVKMVTEVLHR